MQFMKAGATNIAWYIHQFFYWCYSFCFKVFGEDSVLTKAFKSAADEFHNDEAPFEED